MKPLEAPFPWFGGKSTVAHHVWTALGNVEHYVEPFFGSGAVLLRRPHPPKTETINDLDGLLANFWRAVAAAPDEVAAHADWPCNEADLHARHLWLVGQRERITERLMADPDWYETKAAGWWVWGICNWIGGRWCSGQGPWIAVDGELVDSRQLPHLSAGQGINRQLPHLSAGQGQFIAQWFGDLSARLRNVRVACGSWDRVSGDSVLRAGGGICGVFLDPPYALDMRAECYAVESDVARDVLAWCRENGPRDDLRIVLCGYEGEHDELAEQGWRVKAWKTKGGYGSRGNETRGVFNSTRERLWFSPHCVDLSMDLFGDAA